MSATPPPRYLTADDVWAINIAVHRREGTTALLRDRGALEGALQRPQMAAHYEQSDLITQAVLVIVGIAMAHAFLDGNKRTAAIAGAVFLDLNGYTINVAPSDDALGRQVETLVSDHGNAERAMRRFEDWLRSLVAPKP
ncbi:MAG TPA: type II toxin-antitoxin system death-on-curing family toxin [Ktedonobacterales bacterium]